MKNNYNEGDLHAFLAFFSNIYLNAYTKTINHKKSSKRERAEWLHPDMVGINFPVEKFEPNVLNFGMDIGGQILKLYSFELKKELNFSNLRESYFQAVSNSSWANEGYLVAEKIAVDDEFQDELKRLTSAFGIGIIQLDISKPNNSKVLFSSRMRTDLDWETINKLYRINKDFSEFIIRIKNDVNSKEIIKTFYDEILDEDTLIEKLTNKNPKNNVKNKSTTIQFVNKVRVDKGDESDFLKAIRETIKDTVKPERLSFKSTVRYISIDFDDKCVMRIYYGAQIFITSYIGIEEGRMLCPNNTISKDTNNGGISRVLIRSLNEIKDIKPYLLKALDRNLHY